MRLNGKRRSQFGSDCRDTYCEVDGEYHDSVIAHYDSSPAEPDVNWPGDFEITAVELNGKDVMGQMTDAEIAELSERMQELAFPDPMEEY